MLNPGEKMETHRFPQAAFENAVATPHRRHSGDAMARADHVVALDLEYICENLAEEFWSLSGKRLLITGGAGFLGYYLTKSVLHWNRHNGNGKPIHLTVYDNYIRGVPRWLAQVKGDPHITLVKHDIASPLPPDVPDWEYVIHAASIASPTYYRKHPIETMNANVNGLRWLLEYFKAQRDAGKPIGGFLFFSSSEVYGDPPPEFIPTPETYRGNVSFTGPRACYDEAKRYGETVCVNFARACDLPITMARPFNNYGPGLKITDRRVLPDLARDVLAGRDITLLSDGSPTRTYCYVADAIIGYYKILVRGGSGDAYNIGVEAPEISVAQLAERVARIGRELFGYGGKVVRKVSPDQDYLVDNPHRRCPMISKARRQLGYEPTISLDEGLKRLLIWYADHREAAEA